MPAVRARRRLARLVGRSGIKLCRTCSAAGRSAASSSVSTPSGIPDEGRARHLDGDTIRPATRPSTRPTGRRCDPRSGVFLSGRRRRGARRIAKPRRATARCLTAKHRASAPGSGAWPWLKLQKQIALLSTSSILARADTSGHSIAIDQPNLHCRGVPPGHRSGLRAHGALPACARTRLPHLHGTCIDPNIPSELRSFRRSVVRGQRLLEVGPLERDAVRREHVLDRQRRAADAAPRRSPRASRRGEPPLVDLEALAEVDERVAGDHRTLALDPEHGVVRLRAREHVGTERQPVAGRVRACLAVLSRSSQTTSGLPSPACSAVRPYVSMRYCALSGSGV